jgi:hypothetical protein
MDDVSLPVRASVLCCFSLRLERRLVGGDDRMTMADHVNSRSVVRVVFIALVLDLLGKDHCCPAVHPSRTHLAPGSTSIHPPAPTLPAPNRLLHAPRITRPSHPPLAFLVVLPRAPIPPSCIRREVRSDSRRTAWPRWREQEMGRRPPRRSDG